MSTAVTLEEALKRFLEVLTGKNRSPATLRAYNIDLSQFIAWVHANNYLAKVIEEVERADIIDYLSHLGQRGLTGVSRARKIAAIREYFRFLEDNEYLAKSPAGGGDAEEGKARANCPMA